MPAAHPPGLELCPALAPSTLLWGSSSRALRGASARGDGAGGARPGARSPAGRCAGPEAQSAGSPSAPGAGGRGFRSGTEPGPAANGQAGSGAGRRHGAPPWAARLQLLPGSRPRHGRRLEEGRGQDRPEHARVGRASLREAQPRPAPACSGPSRGGGGGRGGGRRSVRGWAAPRRGRTGPPRRRIASRGQFEDPKRRPRLPDLRGSRE